MNENTELIDAINRLEETITKIDEMRYRIIRSDEVVTLGVAKISAAIDKMIADGLMARSALSVATDVQVANQESIVLKPREIATLDFAKKEGDFNSNQWREILDFWKKGGFSFAKTQASVSLVFAKLLKVGALKEIESFHGGSKTLQLTSIGESFLIGGKKRLQSPISLGMRKVTKNCGMMYHNIGIHTTKFQIAKLLNGRKGKGVVTMQSGLE